MKKVSFNVKTVSLERSHLIEASAGTGKTYSIALLVLRLIMESGIDVKQILMVTFTNAAVAELQTRIRIFIKQAYLYTTEEELPKELIIKELVDDAFKKKNKKDVGHFLKGAVLNLDELSVSTIHSFCQTTLSEYAFETDQLSGQELIANSSEWIEKVSNEFWRQYFSTLPEAILQNLFDAGFNKSWINIAIQKAAEQKKIAHTKKISLEEFRKKLDANHLKSENIYKQYLNIYQSEDLLARKDYRKYIENNLLIFKNKSEQLWQFFLSKKSPSSFEKIYPEIASLVDTYWDLQNDKNSLAKQFISCQLSEITEKALPFLNQIKTKHNALAFDDLILKLHKAVKGPKYEMLRTELQKKFKAVFIDEFQDTDALQYEIFYRIYIIESKTPIFFIGDPKQAIYAFRGADIDTYKLATKQMQNKHSMRVNYRSDELLVERMNRLYEKVQNPFFDMAINYEEVIGQHSDRKIIFEKQALAPFQFMVCKNWPTLIEQVGAYIHKLLTNPYYIKGKRIASPDIAILVRKKAHGDMMQVHLSKIGIPSVFINDALVTESEQAKDILYLIECIAKPNKANLSRVFIGGLFNYSPEEVLHYQFDDDIAIFRKALTVWEFNGVYSSLNLILAHYNIKNKLIEFSENGERILTNIQQLAEILNEAENENQYRVPALIAWYKKLVNGRTKGTEAYQKRIETDEQSINILTIHKSKGLAFKIVFNIDLDLEQDFSSKHKSIEYKNKQLESMISFEITEEEKEQYQIQNAQENRRLIYVALTRAEYLNFIFSRGGNNSFSEFHQALLNSDISDQLAEIKDIDIKYTQTVKDNPPLKIFKQTIHKQWNITSYSQIADTHHQQIEKEDRQYNDRFEKFIFETMPKGAMLGNFLHELMEQCDFNSTEHSSIIEALGERKYHLIYHAEHKLYYNELINQVLSCQLESLPFKLKALDAKRKKHELEFYFHFNRLNIEQIRARWPHINTEQDFNNEGVMHGYIDLMFEHNEQFFILDWKSNFLGNSIEKYDTIYLEQAMTNNQYHLQYLVYCLAIYRYLNQKIDRFDWDTMFGGVLYIFMRGCRADKKSGVFFTKPPLTDILFLEQILK
ncbi:MAG: UvrD-helicase domain-containing protein [Bacteroidales bacterium]|nr:UvrD-helicase domain-containing protein [Bacteroidales bacterium]